MGLNVATVATPVGAFGSILAGAGLVVAGGRVATGNSITWDEGVKALAQRASESFFVGAMKHAKADATRFVVAIDLAGEWDAFVGQLKKDGFLQPAPNWVPPWIHRVDPPRKP